jgi:putative flippase GtrA
MKPWTRALSARFVRFLFSGGLNTLVTYVVYLELLNVWSYRPSYTVAYLLGIVLAFVMNRLFVFRSHRGMRSVYLFPLVYVVQYLVSLAVLWVWIDQWGLDSRLGPLIAIVFTIPITYVLSLFIFVPAGGKPSAKSAARR